MTNLCKRGQPICSSFPPSMLLPLQGRKKVETKVWHWQMCKSRKSLGKGFWLVKLGRIRALFCYLGVKRRFMLGNLSPCLFCACVVTEQVAYWLYHIEINTCKLEWTYIQGDSRWRWRVPQAHKMVRLLVGFWSECSHPNPKHTCAPLLLGSS